ncbi:NAD(P)-dependent oxidoreductase [Rhodopseudomonas palustris]|uniref:SDR family oxidoreductase n=1 Tax=Rhodopseudomonas palustris TaxID=1076 RepID=UPI000D1A9169|nr:SDR family oxidoreductase [Rhodopseudomonas palustris]AVT76803.1 NAD(P)-dependent oxidoreductase [Rhodopseudomonas palustris]
MSASRFLVTGASGQLGRLVIDGLLKTVPAFQIGVLVRSEKAAAEFAARGLHVHNGDYSRPDSLKAAFAGVDLALLISSSEIGQRTAQHRNAIEAARQAGVKLLAYTSLLHADTSPLGLAEEHRQTEAALKASGVPHALLRNGWYSENYAASIPAALAHGALLGSADGGRIASAARADYAAAAVRVLTAAEPQAGRIYELAGDAAYTLAEFAAELSRQSGKAVAYRDLPQADYQAALVGAGLPGPFAALLADSDAGAAKGALFDDSHTLSQLIGRPTTPIAATISAALKA